MTLLIRGRMATVCGHVVTVTTPDDLQWEDKVVAILEARDGTILGVVREIKPYNANQE